MCVPGKALNLENESSLDFFLSVELEEQRCGVVQNGIALEVVRVHTSRAQVARVEELQELLEVAQGANAAVLDAACVEAGPPGEEAPEGPCAVAVAVGLVRAEGQKNVPSLTD